MSKLALKYFNTLNMRGLKGKRKDVLEAIAKLVGDRNGRCSPGWETLVKISGVPSATLTRCLRDLEAARLIVRKRRGVKTSKRWGGRRHDLIELVGFMSWKRKTAPMRRYNYDKMLSDNLSKEMGGVSNQNDRLIEKTLTYNASGSTFACHDEDWQSLERSLLDRAGGLQ